MLRLTPALEGGTAAPVLKVRTHEGTDLAKQIPRLTEYVLRKGQVPLSRHPAWLSVLETAFGHQPYCLEASKGDHSLGLLPLAFVKSLLFGRFLVSLPYLNYGGVQADDEPSAGVLVDEAVRLADRLGVRYLELRNGQGVDHPSLTHRMSSKVHMHLRLPDAPEQLMKQLDGKVRNQVRKGQKNGLTVSWGGHGLLADFHAVFSQNMRDLGTPSYGKTLFSTILDQFPDRAELCVVRAGDIPVAAGMLLHGWGLTEVPSASSLRKYNHTNANMLLYWHLLERTIERKQEIFDFGRSSRDSNTHRFKAQWGAEEVPATWLYHVRTGTISEMRPDNPRYQRLIRIWQRLPIAITRLLGPLIVRGIP